MNVVQKVSDYFPVAVSRKKSLITLSKEYLLGRVQTILCKDIKSNIY